MTENDKENSELINSTPADSSTLEKSLISVVVEPKLPQSKSRLVGFQLSFYIGKRILIAAFATVILSFALVTIKSSRTGVDHVLTVEYRDEPSVIMAAVALYLLGVATDIDLTFPLKMLRNGNSSSGKEKD